MNAAIRRLAWDDSGAEAAEWALLAVVLAVAILLAGPSLELGISGAFGAIGTRVGSQVAAALP